MKPNAVSVISAKDQNLPLSCWSHIFFMYCRYGDEQQRQEYLPQLTQMQTLASYCLTEPGSGSDAASLKTKAEKDGSDYVINGIKHLA